MSHLFQLARFCTVGMLCLVISTTALVALNDLTPIGYLAAYVIAFVLGNVAGYLLNARYTFRASSGTKGLARYLSINVLILSTSTLLLRILVEDFHVWYLAASLSLAILMAPVSFVAHRLVSYRRQASLASAPQ